ncbi:hypothetical protein O6P43_013102 [Quillaja saponaria]|uniref:Uncharacterized protein n=1 Tax=Quillaja saponaria TaxID=32244 RepID=A0AAD7M326_QUISA|nr:hypothetical protein O6P43_013102 [Quillaja saponaria]
MCVEHVVDIVIVVKPAPYVPVDNLFEEENNEEYNSTEEENTQGDKGADSDSEQFFDDFDHNANSLFHKSQMPPDKPTASSMCQHSKPNLFTTLTALSPLILGSRITTISGQCKLVIVLITLLKLSLAVPRQFHEKIRIKQTGQRRIMSPPITPLKILSIPPPALVNRLPFLNSIQSPYGFSFSSPAA